MIIFLVANRNMESLLKDIIKKNTGKDVVDIQYLGGWNSKVFKLKTRDGEKFLGKLYLKRDERDRLSIEYNSLKFLWEKGIKNIPEPLFIDYDNSVGIYSFIEGRILKECEIEKVDVEKFLRFFKKLKNISEENTDFDFSLASEASLSLSSYFGILNKRYKRVKNIDDVLLKEFIMRCFDRFFNRVLNEVFAERKEYISKYQDYLDEKEKVLSPSDVGFHNVLKDEEENLYFIDFEYFGWDDPVKMVSDVVLQVDVPLPYKYREYYFKEVFRIFGKGKFLERLKIVYKLLYVKWCFIMLNIFLPEYREKVSDERRFLRQIERIEDRIKNYDKEVSFIEGVECYA